MKIFIETSSAAIHFYLIFQLESYLLLNHPLHYQIVAVIFITIYEL